MARIAFRRADGERLEAMRCFDWLSDALRAHHATF